MANQTIEPAEKSPFEDDLFPTGQLYATEGAVTALKEAGLSPHTLLHRHSGGDWGDLDRADRFRNEDNLRLGGQLLSAYVIPPIRKVWIVTDAAREKTVILLPEEWTNG